MIFNCILTPVFCYSKLETIERLLINRKQCLGAHMFIRTSWTLFFRIMLTKYLSIFQFYLLKHALNTILHLESSQTPSSIHTFRCRPLKLSLYMYCYFTSRDRLCLQLLWYQTMAQPRSIAEGHPNFTPRLLINHPHKANLIRVARSQCCTSDTALCVLCCTS